MNVENPRVERNVVPNGEKEEIKVSREEVASAEEDEERESSGFRRYTSGSVENPRRGRCTVPFTALQ